MLTLRVRVAFGCLSEEDVSALRHGTVFKVIRTGFMTNNDRRLKGICQDSVSPPSRDYQVIMHAFFTRHCEVFTLSYRLYTRIYYVRKEIAKNTYIHAHHRHTWVLKTTHRLWNGSWFHANLKSLFANISLLVLLDTCSGTELPSKSCHGIIQGLFYESLFKHWGFWRRSKGLEVLRLTCYNHVTTLVLLPKKKKQNYEC